MMENLKNKIVFVADIADDIDDVIAVEFLARNGYLNCLVLDGKSNDLEREKRLSDIGVVTQSNIPEDTKIIFCGGALTKVAAFIKNNKLDLLVMNGGFAGADVVPKEKQLEKFKGRKKIRTYNFNMDVDAALNVLSSENINKIVLVSKNVCHDEFNTCPTLHKDEFLNDYNIDPGKRLHDLLMAKEGISILTEKPTICIYKNVDVNCERNIVGNMSKWGSSLNETSKILISTEYN